VDREVADEPVDAATVDDDDNVDAAEDEDVAAALVEAAVADDPADVDAAEDADVATAEDEDVATALVEAAVVDDVADVDAAEDEEVADALLDDEASQLVGGGSPHSPAVWVVGTQLPPVGQLPAVKPGSVMSVVQSGVAPDVQLPQGSPSSSPLVNPSPSESRANSAGQFGATPAPAFVAATSAPKGVLVPPPKLLRWQMLHRAG
jgi:hypothetical protein